MRILNLVNLAVCILLWFTVLLMMIVFPETASHEVAMVAFVGVFLCGIICFILFLLDIRGSRKW